MDRLQELKSESGRAPVPQRSVMDWAYHRIIDQQKRITELERVTKENAKTQLIQSSSILRKTLTIVYLQRVLQEIEQRGHGNEHGCGYTMAEIAKTALNKMGIETGVST